MEPQPIEGWSRRIRNLIFKRLLSFSLLIGIGFLLLITLLFGMNFKFIPDMKIDWRHIWPGAALTAVLFTLGRLLIGIYLGQSHLGCIFGAPGPWR